MSVPYSIFTCSKCKFEQSISYGSKVYYYKLSNEDKITIKRSLGWCFNCKTVTHLHLGLSTDSLQEEILSIKNKIRRIQSSKSFFRSLTKFEKNEIEKLEIKITENQKYLSILNGESTIHSCLECGSAYVFPLNLNSEFASTIPSKTSYLHHNCGGQLMHEYSDFRVSFKTEQVFIKPLLLKPQKETQKEIEISIGPDDIPNYEEVTQMISTILKHERNLFENHKDKLNGFTSTEIFNKNRNTQFMIERFNFIYSYLKYEKKNIDLELMQEYVAAMASQTYGIEMDSAYFLAKERINFYLTELELLKTMEHPHPGKIIWCLYNPSLDKLSNEMDEKFDDNLLGGMFMLKNITHAIEELCAKNKYQQYSNN